MGDYSRDCFDYAETARFGAQMAAAVFYGMVILVNHFLRAANMNTRFTLTAAALLALAACSPAEKEAAAPASAPVEAASAAVEMAASAASEAITDVAPAEHQQVINDAEWQAYQCDDNGKVEARYVAGEAHAVAQIRYNGQTVAMDYNGDLSNEDLTAFSGGDYTWTISNQFGTEFYKEDNGFLVQHEQQEISGESTPVDNILVKNCAPAA